MQILNMFVFEVCSRCLDAGIVLGNPVVSHYVQELYMWFFSLHMFGLCHWPQWTDPACSGLSIKLRVHPFDQSQQ